MAKREKGTSAKSLQNVEGKKELSLFDEMERMFDDFMTTRWAPPSRWGFPMWPSLERHFDTRMPKVDVIERDDEIVVKAELPGVTKDDVDVSITNRSLTIKAHSEHETKEEKGEYYRREMTRGEFQRTLHLPDDVDSSKAKANFRNGILELTIPKTQASKRKTIKVE